MPQLPILIGSVMEDHHQCGVGQIGTQSQLVLRLKDIYLLEEEIIHTQKQRLSVKPWVCSYLKYILRKKQRIWLNS